MEFICLTRCLVMACFLRYLLLWVLFARGFVVCGAKANLNFTSPPFLIAMYNHIFLE